MKYNFIIIPLALIIQTAFAVPPYTSKTDLHEVANVFRDMLTANVEIAKSLLEEIPENEFCKSRLEEFLQEYENLEPEPCVAPALRLISKFRTVIAIPPEELRDTFDKYDVERVSTEQREYIASFMMHLEEIQNLVRLQHGDVNDFMNLIC